MTDYRHGGDDADACHDVEARGDTGPCTDFYALIPAGGVGSRLWPLSRADKPKFLYDLTGCGRTMIQDTVDRLVPLCGADNVMISTGVRHVDAVMGQLPGLSSRQIFAEPVGRDSMAAITLGTAILAKRHGRDIIVGSFAADQVVSNRGRFESVVRMAIAAARAGYVTTIGITPDGPSTAFGYIHQGDRLDRLEDRSLQGDDQAYRVRRFVEKPDAATASRYLVQGGYLWNAGMFIMKAGVLLDHVERLHPDMFQQIHSIAAAWDTPAQEETMATIWPRIEKIAFDYAIAEPVSAEGGVAVVPGDFGWNDIGDFASLSAYIPAADEAGNRILKSGQGLVKLISIDSKDNLIVRDMRSMRDAKDAREESSRKSAKTIALIGLENLAVVDTEDALLVMPKAQAQKVKKAAGIAEKA